MARSFHGGAFRTSPILPLSEYSLPPGRHRTAFLLGFQHSLLVCLENLGCGWYSANSAYHSSLRKRLVVTGLQEVLRFERMELAIQVHVEELPEGLFLATSDEIPGLLAQGRTVAETLEIARDVARKLLEARRERDGIPNLPSTVGRRDYTIIVPA